MRRLRRGRPTAWLLPLILAVLPWLWFPLRDPLGLVGDVAAIVLPVLAVVLVGLELQRLGWRRALLPALSLVLATAVAVVGPWRPEDAGPVAPATAVTVAAANVTGMTVTVPALRGLAADVLVVSEDAPAVDAGLAAAYPHRVLSTGEARVGVYSRFPLRLVEPSGPDLPGVRVAVAAPTPFEVIGVHVPRPWFTGRGGYQATPAEHHRLVDAVAARVAGAGGPVVVAGDLNSTDRARDYRTLVDGVALVDAMRDGWTEPTQVTTWRLFLLRIDHLLVPPGWCGDGSRHVDLPRSDHVAVTATVGPCATR